MDKKKRIPWVSLTEFQAKWLYYFAQSNGWTKFGYVRMPITLDDINYLKRNRLIISRGLAYLPFDDEWKITEKGLKSLERYSIRVIGSAVGRALSPYFSTPKSQQKS